MSAEPPLTLLDLATAHADVLACAEAHRAALLALEGRTIRAGSQTFTLGRSVLLDDLDALVERARATLAGFEHVLLDMGPLP